MISLSAISRCASRVPPGNRLDSERIVLYIHHRSQRNPAEKAKSLEGVAEDVRGFRVVVGRLEELLDCGHLESLLGDLDSVSDADQVAIHDKGGEELLDDGGPQVGELADRKSRGGTNSKQRGDGVGTKLARNYVSNALFLLRRVREMGGFESRPPRHK